MTNGGCGTCESEVITIEEAEQIVNNLIKDNKEIKNNIKTQMETISDKEIDTLLEIINKKLSQLNK